MKNSTKKQILCVLINANTTQKLRIKNTNISSIIKPHSSYYPPTSTFHFQVD